MKTTTVYGLSYPESGDHTRTWEYWQTMAQQVDTLLAGKSTALQFANGLTVGDGTSTNDGYLSVKRQGLSGVMETRVHALATGSGQVALSEVIRDGAEKAQLVYREDGQLFTKSGGSSGTSRPLPWAMCTRYVNVPVGGVNLGTADVTWPTGRFTIAPIIICVSTNPIWFAGLSAESVTGATIYARSYNGSVGGAGGMVGVHVAAFQATATQNTDP